MNAQEYLAAAQSCAITVAFLFITWQLPGVIRMVIAAKKADADRRDIETEKVRLFQADELAKMREFQALESQKLRDFLEARQKADMDARHAQGNLFAKVQADGELRHMETMRLVSESVCRYRPGNGQQLG